MPTDKNQGELSLWGFSNKHDLPINLFGRIGVSPESNVLSRFIESILELELLDDSR